MGIAHFIRCVTYLGVISTAVSGLGISAPSTGGGLAGHGANGIQLATVYPYEYEVYELVDGCDEYEIGDVYTKYLDGVPPYETTIGGNGSAADTKIRLLFQRPA